MSDALPIPPHPDLEQYKKRAKELVKICKSGDHEALRAWVTEWIESLVNIHNLDMALPRDGDLAVTSDEIDFQVKRTLKRITKHVSVTDPPIPGASTLAHAQLVIAREHSFASWPKFAKQLQELAHANSAVSVFESAVDAIVSGDLSLLERLLVEHPELAKARSTREHRSTLLHYVSANGVEDFRQKTPTNIVAIAKRLLDAGADVNAESDAYGGRSTTLGLTATSCHPQAAGVQLTLLDLLIEHGAMIDGPDGRSVVNACLHNGRGKAAQFLASRGARLDLEGAAGVGRLDIVKGFFGEDNRLKPPATQKQMAAGFGWACEFGQTAVVEFLLQAGIDVGANRCPQDRETGLHWAAFEGHADIVRLLLDRGAPVDVRDKIHDGTPLDWALYGWGASGRKAELSAYFEVVALLARAGAKLEPKWYESDSERLRALKKVQADARMAAALRGETVSI